jgi:tetratricopeptide (TPR) repeat protein/nucleoside 2-deoxyribosyltransferase
MSRHSEDVSLIEQHADRSCFIVFSSREPHINDAIDAACDLLINELGVRPIRLDEARQPGEILQTQLLQIMRDCDFAIVFLDGLRPNVVFELGLLVAFDIPRLILLERSSTINVTSLLKDVRSRAKAPKIRIDVRGQLSDVANIGLSYYSTAKDLPFRTLIRRETKKLLARLSKRDGTDLEFKLVGRVNAARALTQRRFESLIQEVAKARPRLRSSQYSHVIVHLSQALCTRGNATLALRLVSDQLHKGPSTALTAQHAYILLQMGQATDAFDEITSALRRHPKDEGITRAYCILALAAGLPYKALKVLSTLKYEQLFLMQLIRAKAQALFMTGKRSEGIDLLLTLYERDRSVSALNQATSAIGSSADSLLGDDLAERLRKQIVVAARSKVLKCRLCLHGAAMVLRIRELVPSSLKPLGAKGRHDAVRCNQRAYDLIQLGRFQEAGAVLKSALKRFPKDSYLHATEGLYFLKGERNLSMGMRRYNEAVELAPDDGALKRMRLYQLGCFYLRAGHSAKARDCFRRALHVVDSSAGRFLVSELRCLLKSGTSLVRPERAEAAVFRSGVQWVSVVPPPAPLRAAISRSSSRRSRSSTSS